MADEAFHEIQLNGKQLVFLFMAATVVAVVIFLCGVMVGRGVRAERGGELAELGAEPGADPTAGTRPAPADVAPAPAPESATAQPQDKLSYPDRLAAQTPAPETLKDPTPPASARASAPARARPDVAPASAAEPAGDGFAVQVAAVRERDEANTIVSRLTTKGYPAYVMSPAAGAPRVFRVRVGKYKDRREAESVAGRLEKEEQFKPWITR